MDTKTRVKRLTALYREIEKRKPEIIQALAEDLGKSPVEAQVSEIQPVTRELRFFRKNLPRWTKERTVPLPWELKPGKGILRREPLGHVAIASPWNYPFQLAMMPLIGGIGGGNRVSLKLSRKSPSTSRLVKDLLESVFSREEVEVYGLEKSDRERYLLEEPDLFFFTGSLKVGRKVAKRAAELLVPCILELGGKSPAILTESCDLEVSAKRIIWGKLMNAGQTCVAPDYVLCPAHLTDEFISIGRDKVHEMYGNDPLVHPDYPKIIDREHFCRLKEKAIQSGFYRECFFNEETGRISPYIFKGERDHPFMGEEIFGPFLPVIPYTSWDQVLSVIAEHPDPLALYLFTKDPQDEKKLNAIGFGGGCINDTLLHVAHHHLPFGGVGQSGLGRYHGEASFRAFTREKAMVKKPFFPDPSLRYPPYSENLKEFFTR